MKPKKTPAISRSESVTYDVDKPSALLAASGLIGVSIVCVVTFTTFATLTGILLAATLCFSAAIPILAACIFLLENRIKAMRTYIALQIVGSILALVGLMGVFLNLNKWAGIIFAVMSVSMLAITNFAMHKDVP